MTIQECGMSDAVLQTLARYMERATDDIKASSLYFHDAGKGVFGSPFPFHLSDVTYKTHPLLQARYEILHGEKTQDPCKKGTEHNAKVEDLYCDGFGCSLGFL